MREEKQLLLNEIKEQIDRSPSFIIADYKGLQASPTCQFRRQLATKGAQFEVLRKRMLIKAAGDMNLNLDAALLQQGHIGIVLAGAEPIEITKLVFQFSKESGQVLRVLGGCIDGRIYNAAQVEQLSKLPNRDQMRAELLGLFEAPQAQALAVMEALVCSVIYCLDNKAKAGA